MINLLNNDVWTKIQSSLIVGKTRFVNKNGIDLSYPERHFQVFASPDVHALVVCADLVEVILKILFYFLAILKI